MSAQSWKALFQKKFGENPPEPTLTADVDVDPPQVTELFPKIIQYHFVSNGTALQQYGHWDPETSRLHVDHQVAFELDEQQ